jgi:hypothetical protein
MLTGINLRNKLAQEPLSPSNCLLPLFEAIANSFNAIDETGRHDGKITVSIVREPLNAPPAVPEVKPTQPVIGFIIQDNGIGFNDKNLASFREAYSDHKAKLGGKGIGRITWLKAFPQAEIDSVYSVGKQHYRRAFTFTVDKSEPPPPVETKDECGTTVTLVGYLSQFKQRCPTGTETIARRIIAHNLETFVLDKCPEIRLIDEYNEDDIVLNRYFRTKLRLSRKTDHFTTLGHRFKVEHLCLTALPEMEHEVHWCAGTPSRSVETTGMAKLIPTMRAPLVNENGQHFVYNAYVTGPHLNDRCDEMRLKFAIPDEDTTLAADGPTWQTLFRTVTEKANEYLKPYIKPLRDKNIERIKEHIFDHEPKYRPLAKHRSDWFEKIPPSVVGDELSVELFRLSRDYDKELIRESKHLNGQSATTRNIESRKKKFDAFLTEWNDQGMSKLAEYVVHRKATLELLRESVQILPSDSYAAEDQIHRIICPMRTTTEDIPPEQMNLWIIDERLNFHRYLASDKPMNTLEPVKVKGQQRADLILFNRALAFTDEHYSSIVVVEFKRPMRNDYSPAENPIDQIYQYVRKLRAAKHKDAKGRPIPKLDSTPIFAYIVCDITPKLREYMEMHQFSTAADEETWYQYNASPNMRVYTEVISFRRLLEDSERRNQVFFDKLRLHLAPPHKQ